MVAPLPLEDARMLRLNNAEMDLLHRLALPIAEERRGEFLVAVADELETAGGVVGEGAVHRAARAVILQFWSPPEFNPNIQGAPRHSAVILQFWSPPEFNPNIQGAPRHNRPRAVA
jgi:hypothetical protein